METDHSYDDIMNRPHHQSATHIPMPVADRAAQFAPFAALTGFEEQIQKTAKEAEELVNRQGYLNKPPLL